MWTKLFLFVTAFSALPAHAAPDHRALAAVPENTVCWCPSRECRDFFEHPYTLSGCMASCSGVASCWCGVCEDQNKRESRCTCETR
jgi:hypothetical protein